jgi:integrase/recombinase XerD
MDAKEPIVLTNEIAPTPALVRAGIDALPAAIVAHGERSARRFIEFFTATIRNRNTRMANARAVKQFFDWCEDHRLSLDEIEPISIATYIEQLAINAAKPTVKRNLAAIRQLFDHL